MMNSTLSYSIEPLLWAVVPFNLILWEDLDDSVFFDDEEGGNEND